MRFPAKVGLGLASDPLAAVLLVAVALMPLLAVYASMGLAALFGVVALVGVLPQLRRWQWPRNSVGLLVPALLVWMALSSLWAIEPRGSLIKSLSVAGLLGIGMVMLGLAQALDERLRRRLGWVAVGGLALALAAILMECATGGIFLKMLAPDYYSPPVRAKRGAVICALLVWPAAAFLVGQGYRWWAAALLAAALAVVAYSPSDAGKLGLMAGLVAAAGGWLLRRRVFPVIAASVAVVVIAAPLAATFIPPAQVLWQGFPVLKFSHHHRLKIWRFAADRIIERPLLGWGMDAARSMPGGDDEESFAFLHPGTTEPEIYREANMPLHPHNAVLQWQLELGLPGLLLMAGLLVAICRAAGRRAVGRIDAALLAGGMSAILAAAAVAFGAWQSWWLSSVMLIATLWATVLPKARPSSASRSGRARAAGR